jgi:malonyl CoA-acyl carrier protein transacylase
MRRAAGFNRSMVAQGDARWIELAPGRVLTGLLKKINRRIPVDTGAAKSTGEVVGPYLENGVVGAAIVDYLKNIVTALGRST